MQPFPRKISALFNQERRYVVPLFQRPYVWSRDIQWEPLWADIAARADREATAPDNTDPPHFLGAIVIQQRRSVNDQLLAHDVIDGQQRLTTLQILLAAFRDVSSPHDERTHAVIKSWTENFHAFADVEVERFKVWPTLRDSAEFRVVMTAGSPEQVEKRYPPVFKRKRLQDRPRMIEAYLFFHDRISEWIDLDGEEGASARVGMLRRVFDKRLELVAIELGELEDPQAIFETLNSRGVPLLASDLLRNFVFHRAGNPSDAASLYQRFWTRFEVPDNAAQTNGLRFWEVEERQGRLFRARLDLFVQHYLAMKTDSVVMSGQLFTAYKTWISGSAPFATVEDELRDLTTFADKYLGLIRPDLSTELGRFAQRLKVLDVSTVYPLVLGLLGNTGLSEEHLNGILTDLESFLVRRLVCGRTTKNYNRLFTKLLRDFEAQEVPSRDAFRSILLAGSGEAVDWPSDTEFETAWATVDAYEAFGPLKVQMILRALEGALATGVLAEKVALTGELSVEHVMPQNWSTWWPLPGLLTSEGETDVRNELIHDFGNLTLLTQPLNSQVSNGPVKAKLPAISSNSRLLLNKTFGNRESWDEKDIQERTAALFLIAQRTWPRP
jgi:hypothetical protein